MPSDIQGANLKDGTKLEKIEVGGSYIGLTPNMSDNTSTYNDQGVITGTAKFSTYWNKGIITSQKTINSITIVQVTRKDLSNQPSNWFNATDIEVSPKSDGSIIYHGIKMVPENSSSQVDPYIGKTASGSGSALVDLTAPGNLHTDTVAFRNSKITDVIRVNNHIYLKVDSQPNGLVILDESVRIQ